MYRWLKLSAASLVFLSLLIVAASAHADNILDDVGRTYQQASHGWGNTLSSIARGLFIKLAMIEILWFGIWWILERDDPRQFIAALLKKMMALLFFWAILLNFDTWIPAIIDGFTSAGQAAGGTNSLTPSTIMDRGLEIATTIISTANNIGLLDGTKGLGKYLIAGLSALAIVLAFGVIAGQMLVTLIESYLIVSAGVLFLGFAGSRWTTTFAEKYISYAVSVGVKLFVTYLVVGAGQNISNDWANTITDDMVVSDYLSVLVGALVYMFLAWQIPAMASSLLSGSVSMTLGGAAATAGTMMAGTAGMAGAAAGAAAAMATGGASSVAGAVKAGTAAVDQAKSSGATSVAGLAGGAAGALAHGIGSAAADGIRGLGSGSAGANLAGRIDTRTAGMREAAAAQDKSSASAGSPGGSSNASAPVGGSGDSTSPVPPVSTSSGPSGAPISQAGQQSNSLSGKSSVSATAANTTGNPAMRATPPAPQLHSSNAGNPENSEHKKGLMERLADGAEVIGNQPNDSAGAAGVQVNFKHD